MKRTRYVVVAISVLILGAVALYLLNRNPQKSSPGSVTIGAILPLSGPSSFLGEDERKAITAMAAMLTKEKGVEVKVLFEDSKNDAKESLAALNKLMHVNSVRAIIATHSGVCGPISEYLSTESSDSPPLILATIVVSTKITENNKVVVRIYPSGRDEAYAMAQYAFTKAGKKKASICYQNDDYGLDGLAQFKETFRSLGGEILVAEAFAKDVTDQKGLAAKVAQAQPEALYIVGNTPAYALLFKQLKEAGYNGQLFSGSALDVASLRSAAGLESIKGALYSQAFSETPEIAANPRYVKLCERLRDAGTTANMLTVYSALCVDIAAPMLIQNPDALGSKMAGDMSGSRLNTIIGELPFDRQRNAILPVSIRRVEQLKPGADTLLQTYNRN